MNSHMMEKQPPGGREWRRMQLQGTSEKAQSVRENIFRLWLVFQRKRERKESYIRGSAGLYNNSFSSGFYREEVSGKLECIISLRE